MLFVSIILYMFKGDFNTDYIDNIDDDDNIINKTFIKINNFIYPDYK